MISLGISQGVLGEKVKLGGEKRKGKESFQTNFLYSPNFCSTGPAQKLSEGFLDSGVNVRAVGWPGLKPEPGMACSNSLSASASQRCCCCRSPAPLPASAPTAARGIVSGGPGAIKSRLLTFPKSAYQPAALSWNRKYRLLPNNFRGFQASCLYGLYL